MINNLTIIM